ncbi:hypothetical protein L198_03121 [Cryptococcus wingfieldii CBS 7118]|uniref:Uncharacterized protein n=1 Tax=Cryptococcus wingfieldii CBS 7118 TaxID=1295528 RepID=A0A1E3JIT5_9TREE|nr:hypothetical protein L198_03121 [Cryptococcus wingfieldii CBS 7118]ODO00794.1 hypothetical protein L198_03121 [Cryptococcus wingfieldii CBS 7118]
MPVATYTTAEWSQAFVDFEANDEFKDIIKTEDKAQAMVDRYLPKASWLTVRKRYIKWRSENGRPLPREEYTKADMVQAFVDFEANDEFKDIIKTEDKARAMVDRYTSSGHTNWPPSTPKITQHHSLLARSIVTFSADATTQVHLEDCTKRVHYMEAEDWKAAAEDGASEGRRAEPKLPSASNTGCHGLAGTC